MDEQQFQYMQQQQMQSDTISQQLNNQQMSQVIQEENKGLLKDQLDLHEELEMIEHLVKGDILTKDKYGKPQWSVPEDSSLLVLSEYGVQLIMNAMRFYLNKNTLLSNYDEESINRKMEDFSKALNDDLFMEYDKAFNHPSIEEVFKVLDKRIEDKAKLRQYAYRIVGEEVSIDSLKEDYLKMIEKNIEVEIEKIKQQLMKNRLKRYELLTRVIQDTVHSAYNRAYMGQERKTLRQHIHVSENMNPTPNQNNQRGGIFSSWSRG